ncbi:MAG: S1 domain-containing RNA-binding protein [Thermincolia bacterium]
MAIEVGSIIEGVVKGITNFGAFVELPGGQTGLVHISEVADAYVRDVKDYLKDQDKVKVKVIAIDEKGKIGLSIKQANPTSRSPERERPREKPRDKERREPPKASFEDRLTRFLKDSDERQQDIRRNTDSKRGGRGGRREF